MVSLFRALLVLFGLTLAASPAFAQLNSVNRFASEMQPKPGGSFLGVQLSDIDDDRAKVLKMGEARGTEVRGVEEGSPAEQAGLKAGDVIVSYNGESILGAHQLGRLVAETPQGRKVKVGYWREGRNRETVATIGVVPETKFGTPPENFDWTRLGIVLSESPVPIMAWRYSTLGIECEPLEAQLAQYFGVKRGALIRTVEKGSVAEKAGLRAGDVLTSLEGKPVSTPRELGVAMRTSNRNEHQVSIEFTRERKTIAGVIDLPVNPQ